MTKVHSIESQLEKLSVKEMCQVRDWLDVALDRAAGLDQLREDVLAGVRQVSSGNVQPFDDAAVERIKARGRKILSEK
jgi:hypothetical protein